MVQPKLEKHGTGDWAPQTEAQVFLKMFWMLLEVSYLSSWEQYTWHYHSQCSWVEQYLTQVNKRVYQEVYIMKEISHPKLHSNKKKFHTHTYMRKREILTWEKGIERQSKPMKIPLFFRWRIISLSHTIRKRVFFFNL